MPPPRGVGKPMTRVVPGALLLATVVSAAACVSHRVEVRPLMPTDRMVVVGPVKVHLRDGSIVVYAPDVVVTVTAGTLRGAGMRYNYALTEAAPVERVPVEMIVGMERFGTEVNRTATALQSVAVVYAVGFVVVGVVLAIAWGL
jgi:hypothetical protein